MERSMSSSSSRSGAPRGKGQHLARPLKSDLRDPWEMLVQGRAVEHQPNTRTLQLRNVALLVFCLDFDWIQKEIQSQPKHISSCQYCIEKYWLNQSNIIIDSTLNYCISIVDSKFFFSFLFFVSTLNCLGLSKDIFISHHTSIIILGVK